MNFFLDTKTNEYAENIRSFLKQEATSEHLKKCIAANHKNGSKLWDKLVELGIFEICALSEQEMGLQNVAALIQEFGFFLVPEPASMQALLGAYLLNTKLGAADKKNIEGQGIDLNAICSGQQGLTASLASSNSQKQIFVPINIKSSYLLACVGPDVLLFSLPDTNFKSIQAVDLSLPLCEINLDHAKGIKLVSLDQKCINDHKLVLIANEVAGILKKVTVLTSDYVKTRKQFGVPVGSFQAIQHKLADMQVACDSLESLCLFAAWALVNSKEQADLAIQSAAFFALNKGLEVVETAIQAHGGIGFTWEYELHYYLRRILFYKSLWSAELEPDKLLVAANS